MEKYQKKRESCVKVSSERCATWKYVRFRLKCHPFLRLSEDFSGKFTTFGSLEFISPRLSRLSADSQPNEKIAHSQINFCFYFKKCGSNGRNFWENLLIKSRINLLQS